METQETSKSIEDENPSISNILSNSETLMSDENIAIILSNSETQMSDENIAEELQLQEALLSSFTTDTLLHKSSSNDDSGVSEIGESSKTGAKRSSSHSALCEICAERKEEEDMFPLQCSHNFCSHCISKHVSILISKRRAVGEEAAVTCPAIDCTAVLEFETLRAVLPADVVSVWDDLLCESLISAAMKFYCPYKDCSGLLVKESDQVVIRESECPFCHRLFCATCNVPWHSGIGCDDKKDERERESDLKLHDLAKESKWQRCPNCTFYVDKKDGCLHMTCRCGIEFCYKCGKAWTSTHVCD